MPRLKDVTYSNHFSPIKITLVQHHICIRKVHWTILTVVPYFQIDFAEPGSNHLSEFFSILKRSSHFSLCLFVRSARWKRESVPSEILKTWKNTPKMRNHASQTALLLGQPDHWNPIEPAMAWAENFSDSFDFWRMRTTWCHDRNHYGE